MEYRVIQYFEDLTDNRFAYHVGDKFPRGNKSVSKERIALLLGKNNKQGRPVIEEVIVKAKAEKTEEKTEVKTEAKTERKTRNVRNKK